MKYALCDCSNEGILFIGTQPIVPNFLKSGLLDCEIRAIGSGKDFYNKVNESMFLNENMHFFYEKKQLDGGNKILSLPESGCNSVFLKRKKLVKIRYPLFHHLVSSAKNASRYCDASIWPGIENNLNFALKDCVDGNWSNSVLEYAKILDLKPEHAYRELKTQIEQTQSTKMKIYSFVRYFRDLINQIEDENQFEIQNISRNIEDKFFRDSFI
jgi:hypothetical protein